MKPTSYFKWVESCDDQLPIIRTKNSDYTNDKNYLVLQQWWENEDGEGEWRNIPISYKSSNSTPPE